MFSIPFVFDIFLLSSPLRTTSPSSGVNPELQDVSSWRHSRFSSRAFWFSHVIFIRTGHKKTLLNHESLKYFNTVAVSHDEVNTVTVSSQLQVNQTWWWTGASHDKPWLVSWNVTEGSFNHLSSFASQSTLSLASLGDGYVRKNPKNLVNAPSDVSG